MNAIGINCENPYQTAAEDLEHTGLYQDAKNNVFNNQNDDPRIMLI